MRKGLFLCALLATVMVGGTALAERNDTDNKPTRGQRIKEEVLAKQREGFAKVRSSHHADRSSKSALKTDRSRPHGEVYGDQATRGAAKVARFNGKNMSATGNVNTPAEIKRMRSMINPMYGAYRNAQDDQSADAYGGQAMVPNGRSGSGLSAKNMSATGNVNTPAEIKKMIGMINPMYGAYRMAAGDGTDAYGGRSMSPQGYHNASSSQGTAATRGVHFKNDKGEVNSSTHGNTATAMKNRALKNQIMGLLKAKMAEKANIAGK